MTKEELFSEENRELLERVLKHHVTAGPCALGLTEQMVDTLDVHDGAATQLKINGSVVTSDDGVVANVTGSSIVCDAGADVYNVQLKVRPGMRPAFRDSMCTG